MIHERGYWMDKKETDTHEFDGRLANSIGDIFPACTLVDMGCGNGKYFNRLGFLGFDVKGYDGSPLTPELTGGACQVCDFSYPVDIGQFDLVLSLEVGEHIPREYETIFNNNLAAASKKWIILSWAVEGQPGVGHFNCRNNDYIASQLQARRFRLMKWATTYLRQKSTLPWFKNTLMVFRREKDEN